MLLRYKHIISIFALTFVAACAPTPKTEKPSAALTTQDFPSAWIAELKQDAKREGVRESTINNAFTNLKLLPRVIELDGKQPERKLTFDEYITRVVTSARIETGKAKLAENRALIEKASAAYGVEPEFIVALWGVETSYGENTGNYSVLSSLATLAFEGRRGEFFRSEFLHALKIVDNGHITAQAMDGSWAGAMGQCQFMPSSFNRFAVDFNRDGRKDIWYSDADVFGSIANYLAESGWQKGAGWGSRVTLPTGFNLALADGKIEKSLEQWKKLGVKIPENAHLTGDKLSIVLPGEDRENAHIVTRNYKTLLKWNRSLYFATSVGMIADAFKR